MIQNVAGAMLNVTNTFTSIQPKLPRRSGSSGAGRLDLTIVGLATQYPPHELGVDVLESLAKRHYTNTPA